MFEMVNSFTGIIFVIVIGMFIFIVGRSIFQWGKNNNSPKITVDATIVSKRTKVSHHHSNSMHMGSTTTYYVTFQFDSGDRMELRINGFEYGMLAERDVGKLTFQGTRYIEFVRL